MRYLFGDWDKIKKNLSNKYIMLFLDYDGTLTPIVERPAKAVIPQETKSALADLVRNPKIKIAIVSGRALQDVKGRVRIKDVIYIGNHGLEIEGPKIKFTKPVSTKQRAVLEKIKKDLTDKISSIKGVILEDKGLSLSVHFRLVEEREVAKVKTLFHETIITFLVRGEVKIKPGKKVLEVRLPVEWDKGRVVLWLLARWKFSLKDKDILPVYLGDDVTDEDAFSALINKGITVFVGEPKKSNAQYYLKNTQEVKYFLNRIAQLQ